MATAQAPDGATHQSNAADASSIYECNICLDTAKDAVVSYCGHLFCWPCLHQWLETRPNRQMCPVCKAGISRDKVIPVYGRGSTDNKDPREKLPPRPAGQRTEPESANPLRNFNMQMSFGIGAFPFSFFNMDFGDGRPGRPATGTQQHQEELLLSKIFLIIAFCFGLWLLLI